jgi:sterol desaturase/sphingolipid hydroxylase (fatty acid hydroxylase superfamily)
MKAPARYWLWPVFVGVSALAYGIGFVRGFAVEVVLLLPAVQVLILYGLELWLPAEREGPASRDPKLGNDIAHNIFGFALGGALSDAVVLALAAMLAAPLSMLTGGVLWPASLPFAAQALLAIVLADMLETLRHRHLHHAKWLWPIHAVHHQGEHLHVLKSGRNHFLDIGLRGAFVFAPLALLGAPAEVMLAYPAAVSVLGPIGHANLDLVVPRWLHRWLMTPAVHHIHHARTTETALHNYANVSPFWDRLLGTFLDPGTVPRPAAGLDDDPNPPGFWGQVLAPLGLRGTPRAAATPSAADTLTP